jgi:hypothetical protein
MKKTSTRRTFKANCPYCKHKIIGYDDWAEGYICIMGFCKNCQIFIAEEETDWCQLTGN